jgi:large subunit ribosomal protein L17
MRHKKKRLQLNRFTSWHKATVISLVKSLLTYQSIKTTVQKAKAAKPLADKIISLAKQNTLAAKRHAYEILGDHELVSGLFNDIAGRFKDNNGGFTRIINLGARRGDNASMAIFELTQIKKKLVKKHKKEEEKAEKAPEQISEEAQTSPKTETGVKEERHPETRKQPNKKFLGGIRNIFKKERDSL